MSYFDRATEAALQQHLRYAAEAKAAIQRQRDRAQERISDAEAELATLNMIAPMVEIQIEVCGDRLRKIEESKP